ncbi:retron Eco8 family effector endonuclease [Bacillus cereus]|nr:retron Eco8 family effector endonuclease [Bacillus cereus]
MLRKVKVKNCKSIKKLDVDISKINSLIGKNGVGKTTFIKCIEYFYGSLDDKKIDFTIFDQNNPYNEFSEIEMIYDFSYFSKVIEGYQSKYFLGEVKKSLFMNYLGELCSYVDSNNNLTIKLLINKTGEKKWFPNLPFELRKVLKTIYPFYFITTKNYNQTNWETMWEMIGDLAKVPSFNIEEDLGDFLEENYGSSFARILKVIKNELEDANIIVDSYTNQEKFLTAVKLQLGGERLQFKYKDLSFFSEGTNSFNYLKLFCSLVNKIAEQKLKIPLLLLDEPEAGLHPKYIDDLMIDLLKTTNKNQIFIATHSSRILKNIIRMTKEYNVLHAIHENDYTNITVVNQFLDHRERNILSDEEASYYFSNKIVFVEGDTELELFNNHNLLELFPYLRTIDFYSFDASTVNLSTIHPKVRNTQIPFLIIVDNDYIFKFNKEGFARINKGGKDYLNPLDAERFEKEHNKEPFHFGDNSNLYYLRKRINKMEVEYRYSYNRYWFTVYGSHFKKFKEHIKKYCIKYNVYPVSTTIEGALINDYNLELFKNWLISRHPNDSKYIENLYNISRNLSDKASAFRLIVHGNYDTLTKIKKDVVINTYPDNIKKSYILIKRLMGHYKKTSGWVTDWLDYVFDTIINKKESPNEKEQLFRLYFPELYDIIKTVYTCK